MRVCEGSNRIYTADSRASVKPVCRSESNGSDQRHETPAPGILKNELAMEWINIIIQGVLIGGLYAMFAAGLALIFGVMRLVNIAHGDLIVLAAYIALMTSDTLGLNPLLAIIVVVPIMAAVGHGLPRALLNPTPCHYVLPPLLVTFRVSVLIQ